MKTYRLKIKLLNSFATPWHADTLFGSICWLIAWRYGTETLVNLLKDYIDKEPPFLLSDGFPGDLFPSPVHLPLMFDDATDYNDYRGRKYIKDIAFLDADDFQKIRQGYQTLPHKMESKPFQPVNTIHNSINRMTGTTGDEGSLYEIEEWTLKNTDTISFYLKIKDGWEERVSGFFHELALSGYGKKKSIGKGSFEVVGEMEPFDAVNDFEGSNGFMALNNFMPSPNDPVDGFYKTTVKYGKLGGEYTFCGNPFKKPLVMISAGSVFRANGEVKDYYGRMVPNVSPVLANVVHYGYAFAVPLKIAVT